MGEGNGRKPGSGRRPRKAGFPVFRQTHAPIMREARESVVTLARPLWRSPPAITLGYYVRFIPEAGSKRRGIIDGPLGGSSRARAEWTSIHRPRGLRNLPIPHHRTNDPMIGKTPPGACPPDEPGKIRTTGPQVPQTRSWKTVYQGYVPTTAPSAVTASSV